MSPRRATPTDIGYAAVITPDLLDRNDQARGRVLPVDFQPCPRCGWQSARAWLGVGRWWITCQHDRAGWRVMPYAVARRAGIAA